MTTAWLLLGLAAALTAATAFFVAAEFALLTVDRAGLERQARGGDPVAGDVLVSLRSLSRQLSAAQIGITATTLLVGYLAEPSLARLLRGPLRGLGLPVADAGAAAVALALVVATAFSMVVGELAPKNLAIARPAATARAVARPLRAVAAGLGPLIRLLDRCATAVLGLVGVVAREELPSARPAPELAALVRRSAALGLLSEGTADLLTRSLELPARTAADVMTPRVRAVVVHDRDSAADVVAAARSSGRSRFPVIGQDMDDVLGVVHLKAAVAVPRAERAQLPVSRLMVPALRLPETVRLDPLLVALRGHGLQLAVVVDEYGGTAGVVTLEDVVEEVVGEVSDEHDRSRPGVVRRADGSWLVPGLLRPDEVRLRTGVQVPESPAYETVGGLVMAVLGRVPSPGDELALPAARLRVERMDGRRVDRVRLVPLPEVGRAR